MKLVYLSTFMNQHQLPLSLELSHALGDNYRYIALNGISEGRKKLGQVDLNDQYPFIVRPYESDDQMLYAKELINKCDILLAGHCPDDYLTERIYAGKPVIKTCERYFKETPTYLNRIKHFIRAKRHLSKFQNKSFYFLCASAYTANDVNKYTDFSGKTYKWGYFTECKNYDNINDMIKKKEENSLLWVGRMIDWKHPETPILVAKKLKEAGYCFTLKMIGTGEMEGILAHMIAEAQLDDCVSLLGAKKSDEVRTYMEKSLIYLFTSNQEEGWGAVLNESMNSGCAVVANIQIGAVPFLLKDGENGLVYSENSIDIVYQKVKYLLDNREVSEQLGITAYKTIVSEWSPKIAASRLLEFCDEIKSSGKCELFDKGPCSRT